MPKSPPKVLVTDANERAVLAAIRALAVAGYRVGAATHVRPAPGQWSRACSERFEVVAAREDALRFVEQLADVVRGGDYVALLVGSDAALLAVSEHRAALEPHVALGLPCHDAVVRALSKLELTRAAAAVGFPTPATTVCEDAASAYAAAAEHGYPVVAKSASVVVSVDGLLVRPDTRLVGDEAALSGWLAQEPGLSLIQARELGPTYSYAGVFDGDALIGTAFARYVRTWPVKAGNASCAVTEEPPEGLGTLVMRLLERLGWRGMFELELLGRPDGSYAVIDLNPRVYGSLSLAVRAGAPLPALLCDMLRGETHAPRVARAGVRYRWEEGEVRHLFAQLRDGRPAAAAAVLRPRRSSVHAEFSLGDPKPLGARGLLVFRRALASGRRRRSTRRAAGAVPAPAAETARTTGRRSAGLPVVVLGAGPYGLAVGAHLRDADVEVRQFGRPMSYWREQMPQGMMLRSTRQASSISDPHNALRIEHHAELIGRPLGLPIPIGQFIDYAMWFQGRTAPDLDTRRVADVSDDAGTFVVTLEDGEQVRAGRVVVAAGLESFPRRPAPFSELSPSLVSHAADHSDLSGFAGRRVAVIGSGQSATESAALLSEEGAQVELIARRSSIVWLGNDANGSAPRIRFPRPPTDVGGRVTGWIAATPDSYRRLPSRARGVVSVRCLVPAGAGWLRDRVDEVVFTLGRSVSSATPGNDGLRLVLDDGTERVVDHVLLGTGYEVDVRRYPFLKPELTDRLALTGSGLPLLGPGLESSVPGLHFVGAPAVSAFGPIMRFVVGTWYAAPAVARRVTGRRQPPLAVSY